MKVNTVSQEKKEKVKLNENEVEIGILNRETNEIFTSISEKDNPVYMSVGSRMSEDKIVIYAFESNAELFTMNDNVSGANINRTFLKKYKILKPSAVKRFRNECLI